MEIYDDQRAAFDRVKHLNKVSGSSDYHMTYTTDGRWVVRRYFEQPRPLDPAYIKLKNWLRQQAYGASNARARS